MNSPNQVLRSDEQQAARAALAASRAREAIERRRRRQAYLENIPPHLRRDAFDEARFTGDADAFFRVRGMIDGTVESEKCGFYLFGPTGAGKTRAAIEYYDRICEATDCAWWSAAGLKSELARLRASEEGKADLLDQLVDAEDVFIDDLGHVVSESFLEFLRQLLELRGPRGVVVTSQFSMAALQRRGAEAGLMEVSAAILRRIEESCEIIRFRSSAEVDKSSRPPVARRRAGSGPSTAPGPGGVAAGHTQGGDP